MISRTTGSSTLAFDMDRRRAQDMLYRLKGDFDQGIGLPSIWVDEQPDINVIYADFNTRNPVVFSTSTWVGHFQEEFFRNREKTGMMKLRIPEIEITHKERGYLYLLKLDNQGKGVIEVRVNAIGRKIPEEELRTNLKQMFENLGIPAGKVDEIALRYSSSVW